MYPMEKAKAKEAAKDKKLKDQISAKDNEIKSLEEELGTKKKDLADLSEFKKKAEELVEIMKNAREPSRIFKWPWE